MNKTLQLIILFFGFCTYGQVQQVRPIQNINSKLNTAIRHLQVIFAPENSQKLKRWINDNPSELAPLLEKVSEEVFKLSITVDLNNTQPFWHLESATWIETEVLPFSQIRIRPLSRTGHLIKSNTRDLLSFLAHEIGHHIVGQDETLSWKFSNLVIKYIESQIMIPQMLTLSEGNFNTSLPGCRDSFKVERIDLMSGEIQVTATSRRGHCRIFKMKSDNYQFDQINMTLVCEILNGEVYCFDKNPAIEFRACPNYNRKKATAGYGRERTHFRFDNSDHIHARYLNCLYESKKAAFLNKWEAAYFLETEPLEKEISTQRLAELEKTDSEYVGLYISIGETVPSKASISSFLDE